MHTHCITQEGDMVEILMGWLLLVVTKEDCFVDIIMMIKTVEIAGTIIVIIPTMIERILVVVVATAQGN